MFNVNIYIFKGNMKSKNKIKKNKSKKDILKSKLSSLIKERWEEYKNTNNATNYIIHVGPTNSGKSYNALKAVKSAYSGACYVPLRMLAYEMYMNINESGVDCSLITGEEKIIKQSAKHIAATIEMFDPNKFYDTILIDEFQNIADENRGNAWLSALLQANANEVHIITAPHALNLLKRLLEGSNKTYTVNEYKRLVPLNVSEETYDINKPKSKTAYVTFSRKNVLELKNFFNNKGIDVSVIYGGLPALTRFSQIKQFIDGKTDIIITTDALGQGINIPCDNVCFMSTSKFDGKDERKLNISELQQLAGRAGRYLLSNQGEVSAVSKSDLSFIKDCMSKQPKELTKAKIEPSLKELEVIQEDSLYKKLLIWKDNPSIPQKLKNIVEVVSIDEQIELSKLITYTDYCKLGLEKCYELVQAPTTKDTVEYWERCFKNIVLEKEIPLPGKLSMIDNQQELFLGEKFVKQCDLYLWLYNKKMFNKLAPKGKDVIEHKYYLSNMIDKALSNNLSLKRVCRICSNVLDVYHAYNICEDCFNEKYN